MSLYRGARRRASLYNLDFNILPEDIIIPDLCPVFQQPFEIGSKGGNKYSPTLDRINPELGYVKGNIQVISRLANMMKNCASEQELTTFAKYILNK